MLSDYVSYHVIGLSTRAQPSYRTTPCLPLLSDYILLDEQENVIGPKDFFGIRLRSRRLDCILQLSDGAHGG